MPHHPEDNQYFHLPLIQEDRNPRRRPRTPQKRRQFDGQQRLAFGQQLDNQLETIEREARIRPAPIAGIQPHLVFRVPLAPDAYVAGLAERLREANVVVVSVESDGAVIAFSDDAHLAGFRNAVNEYISGPKINRTTGQPYGSTKWDVFESIVVAEMRLWGREDRIGPGLRNLIGQKGDQIELGRVYTLDVELWHQGSRQLANAAIDELRRLVANQATHQERVCDFFVGESLCLARALVTGAKLEHLLNLDVLAEADVPIVPVFDRMTAEQAQKTQFPTPPRPVPDGPSVCILDSGIVPKHPLLENNIGHYESFLTNTASGVDEVGHGTLVAGVAVFGDVRASYEAGMFASEVTVFSARLTSPDLQFDDEQLVVNQIGRAIRLFKSDLYKCNVFNLSLGGEEAWLQYNNRQSLWAESLDILAREEQVLIVVSAGNHQLGHARTTGDAETVLARYPDYLFEPECGLNSPATAAIPLTVGGIADHEGIAIRRGRNQDDLALPVARVGEPSPITRIGPGLNNAVKPEFVASAGNQLFQGFGSSVRQVGDDPGLSVMSFSHQPTETLFAYGVGTSYAAPRIARIAALVWQRLKETLADGIDPNLVRAVLATASYIPASLYRQIAPSWNDDGVRRVCGYGAIDEDLALFSGDRRVTLVAQNRIEIDSFLIYAVPIPDEFRLAEGKKRIIVALAFDPPVRRRRAKYLGVEMDAYLIRGKTIDDIVEAYRAVSREERETARLGGSPIAPAIKSPYKCELQPSPTVLGTSTLQRSEWAFNKSEDHYGDTYYVVVRAKRNWAQQTTIHQSFGLAVTMETISESRLYALVRQRISQRIPLRQRILLDPQTANGE